MWSVAVESPVSIILNLDIAPDDPVPSISVEWSCAVEPRVLVLSGVVFQLPVKLRV